MNRRLRNAPEVRDPVLLPVGERGRGLIYSQGQIAIMERSDPVFPRSQR